MIRQGREAAVRVRARERLERTALGCPMHHPRRADPDALERVAAAIAATSLLLASPLGPALLWQDWVSKQGRRG